MKQPKLSDLKIDTKGTKAVRKIMAKRDEGSRLDRLEREVERLKKKISA